MLFFLMLIAASGVSTRVITNTTNTLSVTNGNEWGYWSYEEYCVDGTYAFGYDMKIEKWQRVRDDTAMNGIKLICQSPDGNNHSSATSEVGPWGDWVGEAHCNNHYGKQHFLTSFSLQVEPQGKFDDTSANFIKFKCRDVEATEPSYEMSKDPGFGRWGTYGEWSSECPAGQAICGIKTRIESIQGLGDDTALNDVVFFCCPYYDFLNVNHLTPNVY